MERSKLVKIHENQIMAGLHRGRINLSTGLTEPYFIVDLPSPDQMQENAAFTHQAEDAKSLQKVYDHIKQKSSPIVSLKTNLYLDRFIRLYLFVLDVGWILVFTFVSSVLVQLIETTNLYHVCRVTFDSFDSAILIGV